MLDHLLQLIEAGPGRALSLRALESAPSGHNWGPLLRLGAVRPGPPLREILCPWCDSQRVRPRFRSEDRYIATCFECGEVSVDAAHLTTVAADFDWIFRGVFRAFRGSGSVEPRVEIPDLLWSLGELTHRGVAVSVLLARLDDSRLEEERVARFVAELAPSRRVLVLTSRASALRHLTAPGQRVIASLPDVATLDDYGFRFDHARLLDFVAGAATAIEPEVDVALDGSWLRVNGRELRLSGKQRDFALVMVQAWSAGQRRPKLEWVLRRAGYGDGTSELRHVTKRPEFFEFFGYGTGEVWIAT